MSTGVTAVKRVGLYCRVSTHDRQNIDTQLLPLREYSGRRGFHIAAEYADVGVSGTKDHRPGLDRIMEHARRRVIDAVLVARFDRFARSVSHLVRALEEFEFLGVDFISLNESIDTSTPMGKMVFTVLAAVAELERNIIIERVKAGMRRAKQGGKHIGRHKVIFDRGKAIELREQGASIRTIAERLDISRETVRKTLTAWAKQGIKNEN